MTTCPCGTPIDSELAAQSHAKDCHLQGYPVRRCTVPLGGDGRSLCGLPMPCREHEGEAS